MRRLFPFTIPLLWAALLCASPSLGAVSAAVSATAGSVLRVNSTNQAYDFLRPWVKHPPYQLRALGAVLPEGRILTTAEQVANSTFLELEKPEGGEKSSATVEIIDYECNLALLKAGDPAFIAPFQPFKLGEANLNEELCILQLESSGAPIRTKALLTTVEASGYPIGELFLLVYQLTTSLQPRDSTFTAPLVAERKAGAKGPAAAQPQTLVGLLQRYNSRNQMAEAIPAPVIRHFLQAAAAARYQQSAYTGFPRAGLAATALRDPQLRHYAGLSGSEEGVYIVRVQKDGPAERAGIRRGDVLTAIDGHPLDRDGNYTHPRYGKISRAHLLSCEHFSGDTIRLALLRDGKPLTCELTLVHSDPAQALIEPFSFQRQPRYRIAGGLVFLELSRQYLLEWGQDWVRKAPEKFVYYTFNQEELFQDDPRRRIVILSGVLPTRCTIGYENLGNLIVTKINGMELKDLEDVHTALAKPLDGFHRIEFSGHPGEIILDAAQMEEQEPHILRNYGLPALQNR